MSNGHGTQVKKRNGSVEQLNLEKIHKVVILLALKKEKEFFQVIVKIVRVKMKRIKVEVILRIMMIEEII